jgi:hypothetical protein
VRACARTRLALGQVQHWWLCGRPRSKRRPSVSAWRHSPALARAPPPPSPAPAVCRTVDSDGVACGGRDKVGSVVDRDVLCADQPLHDALDGLLHPPLVQLHRRVSIDTLSATDAGWRGVPVASSTPGPTWRWKSRTLSARLPFSAQETAIRLLPPRPSGSPPPHPRHTLRLPRWAMARALGSGAV